MHSQESHWKLGAEETIDEFSSELEKKIQAENTHEELISLICKTANKHKGKTRKGRRQNRKPWFDKEVKDAFRKQTAQVGTA